MSGWAHLENIALIAAFAAIVVLGDGWGKAAAIVPVLFLNYPKKKEN